VELTVALSEKYRLKATEKGRKYIESISEQVVRNTLESRSDEVTAEW
jgi:hypothetical protein